MVAAELVMNSATGVPFPDGTKGITGYIEVTGTPEIEVIRVHADASGDYFYSRKFKKIKSFMVQNHGASMATGVSRDPPKVVVTNAGDTSSGTTAKFTITHTATDETFSFIIFGEL